MCLILFGFHVHPQYKLVLIANRDEFFNRSTAPLSQWPDNPDIYAGKDLVGFGTWLGITRKGQWSGITNYREPNFQNGNAPSRGEILVNFLKWEKSIKNYLEQLRSKASTYNGFNLLCGTQNEIWYFSNRSSQFQCVEKGIHGLSNHLMDTPWPKVAAGKAALIDQLENQDSLQKDLLFDILKDKTTPLDKDLPDTGVGLTWERLLSSRFISSPIYGTRSSSLLMIDHNDNVAFTERTYDIEAHTPDNYTEKSITFPIES